MTEPGQPTPTRKPPGRGGQGAPAGAAADREEANRGPRPIIERVGLAAIAIVMAGLFAIVAVAAFQGGELFLAVMGALGCLMILWVGGLTLIRG